MGSFQIIVIFVNIWLLFLLYIRRPKFHYCVLGLWTKLVSWETPLSLRWMHCVIVNRLQVQFLELIAHNEVLQRAEHVFLIPRKEEEKTLLILRIYEIS